MGSTTSKMDPLPPDKSSRAPGADRTQFASGDTNAQFADVPVDYNGVPIDLLALIGRAEDISRQYQQRTVEQPMNTAYRAWNNQHAQNSKYLGNDFKGRSRLFVPKTRAAVRKNLATAAGALFTSEDVVGITAAYEDDPRQLASAAVLRADLTYRLFSGTSTKTGIPWFQISMGACHDAQLSGVCVSKQFWEYEEVPTREVVEVMTPLTDEETGEPIMTIDAATGQETPVMWPKQVPKMRVVKDRPMCMLIPLENCYIDPAAPWYAPAQLGRWFSVRYPMGLSDVHAMLRSGQKDGRETHWIDVSDATLLKGRIDDWRQATRRARENVGSDRYEDARGTGDLDIVWVQENFLRISGVDYHWWSVGRFGFISKVRETHEAYPEFDGERPYVMGVAGIDPHRVFPMSPVHSWQPLQLELNDITNLRQDTLKRAIAPLTVVRRGSNVDRVALARRGQPNAVVEVDKTEDIEFQSTPGPSGASYTEASVQNASFDELAGVFSTSSVQSSRQLNETVGGMRIMTGAANAVSEFDLKVWLETWVEPVVRHFVHLLRTYESDEKVLAIAGAKARVMEQFNYLPTLSDFQATELLMRVNASVASLDPMQGLAKFKMAMEMLAPAFPAMQAQGIKPRYEEFINEVMGKAGYKDGRRFFEFGDPPEQQPDPETQRFLAEIEFKNKEMESNERIKMAEMRSEEKVSAADNLTDIEEARIRAKAQLAAKAVDVELDREQRADDERREDKGAIRDDMREARAGGREDARAERQANRDDQRVDRQAAREDARSERSADREDSRAAEGRKAKISEILTGAAAKGGAGGEKKDGGGSGGGQGKSKSGAGAGADRDAGAGAGTGKGGDTSLAALKAVMARLDEIASSSAATQKTVSALAAHMNSPAEVVRDGSGRATAIRKGNQTTEIRYDNGRLAGTAARNPRIDANPGAAEVAEVGPEG